MKIAQATVGLGVCMLLGAASVHAAELGFYVGGAYGTASKDVDIAPFNTLDSDINAFYEYTATQRASTIDTDGSGYSFYGGYRFLSWLAVEAGYMNIGKVNYRSSAEGFFPPPANSTVPDFTPLTKSLTANSGGIAVSVLGVLPLSYRWEAFGRAGALFATNEFSSYLADNQSAVRGRVSESSTDLLGGVGIDFLLAEVYTLRAEYIRVFDAGDSSTGEGDVDLLTIGVTVRF